MRDSIRKTAIKTVTWRIIGSTAAFIISWLVTGSATQATLISILHAIINMFLYFVHERIWSNIK